MIIRSAAAAAIVSAVPRVSGGTWDLECVPLQEMGGLVNFCEDILLNATAPNTYYVSTHISPIVQDSLARQSSETVLSMATSCRSIVISDQCVQSYREYACVSNFLFCNNHTDADAQVQGLLQPCRSMCFKYCEDCRLDICPCAYLPETNCYTHGTVGLGWNSTEVLEDSSTVAMPSVLALATAAAALTALGRR